MNFRFVVLLTWLLLGAASAQDLEIRFCPAGAVWSYPLAEMHGVSSLLLQNAAVIHHGTVPLTITRIDLALLAGGEVRDERHLTGAALQEVAAAGPQVQQSGMLKLAAAFQFCGDKLIDESVKLAGPTLGHNEGLLMIWQPFAYSGARDTLRLTVTAGPQTVQAELPIKSGFAKHRYTFPLRGTWLIGAGASFHTGHRWTPPEEFALDIAKTDAKALTHKGDGTRFADYYAYGAEVLAAADGRVIAAEDGLAEDPGAMAQKGESKEAYFARLMRDQSTRIAQGHVTGNYVMIDHGGGEYSFYAHLKPQTVAVKVGDSAKAGQVIGKLGSSGNSSEPHLHFHVCDAPDALRCAGIPVQFSNIDIANEMIPRALQSGDVVIAK